MIVRFLLKVEVIMQFYYGDKNILRVLDEAEFWKRQEKEHTVVIRTIATGLEPEYVQELIEFEAAFIVMEGKAIQLMETVIRAKGHLTPDLKQETMRFIEAAINQSRLWIQFLDVLATQSNAVRMNQVVLVVISHIRRESEYFIGIAQTILYN